MKHAAELSAVLLAAMIVSRGVAPVMAQPNPDPNAPNPVGPDPGTPNAARPLPGTLPILSPMSPSPTANPGPAIHIREGPPGGYLGAQPANGDGQQRKKTAAVKRRVLSEIRDALRRIPADPQTGMPTSAGVLNLKVVWKKDDVVFTGTVPSQKDKDAAGARASAAAGDQSVVNQLVVEGPQ